MATNSIIQLRAENQKLKDQIAEDQKLKDQLNQTKQKLLREKERITAEFMKPTNEKLDAVAVEHARAIQADYDRQLAISAKTSQLSSGRVQRAWIKANQPASNYGDTNQYQAPAYLGAPKPNSSNTPLTDLGSYLVNPRVAASPAYRVMRSGYWVTYDQGRCYIAMDGQTYILVSSIDGASGATCGNLPIRGVDQNTMFLRDIDQSAFNSIIKDRPDFPSLCQVYFLLMNYEKVSIDMTNVTVLW